MFNGTVFKIIGTAVAVPVIYQLVKFATWIWRTCFVIGPAVNKLPGDPLKWPYGNLAQHPGCNEKLVTYLKSMVQKYPRMWRTWFGPFVPFVSLCHPETIKILVKTEEPKFTGTNSAYLLLRPWLGDGLLISEGQRWKRNRRLLTPAFHFDILRSYIDIYNEAVEILLNDKQQLKMAKRESQPYAKAVLAMSRLVLERAFNPLHRVSDKLYFMTEKGRKFKEYCDFVHRLAEEVIAKRRKTLIEDPSALRNKKYLDFLDILLQARDQDGVGLSDSEIRNEVDTFLFEGHDTTASGISWTLYSLAKYPEYQKRAQQEVDDILSHGEDRKITWDDLQKLPYLTQCIKEAMRLWSPVPVVCRQLSQPVTIDGITLPTDTLIDINIYSMHHNPTVWGNDHDDYNPERFHPDNINKMDTFAFLPFSAGPRNCIGQNFAMNEEKVHIARILHRFDLSIDESHQILPRPELVTRSMSGIKLFMKPRNQKVSKISPME